MPSMLEVLREYKHLAAQRKAEGSLPPVLQARFVELEALVRAETTRRKSQDLEPAPRDEGAVAPAISRPPSARSASVPGRSGSVSARPRAASVPARSASVAARSSALPATPLSATARSSSVSTRPPAAPPGTASGGLAPRAKSSTRASAAPAVGTGGAAAERSSSVADRAADALGRLLGGGRRKASDRSELWNWAAVLLLVSLGLVFPLGFGLAVGGGVPNLLTGVAMVGVGAWLVIYPALLAWREWAAGRSSAHLNEPDFQARTPIVEPVVALLAAMAAVLWLQLGGYADEGLPRLLGYLTGLACWVAAFGWATALVLRPIAARYTKIRAYRQYMQGGLHTLDKNNTKRARRLFELAIEAAANAQQRQNALQRLEEACRIEADELRVRGYYDRADDLVASYERLAKRSASIGEPAPESSASTPSASIDLVETTAPRLLSIGEIEIARTTASPTDGAERRMQAGQLSARGRNREALELLVAARLSVPPQLARSAAQEYIQQGLLRSADAVYDALNEPQIPEFYKAVAVEWSRQEGAPPEPVLRLAKLLDRLSETQVAARISCQGVLSGLGSPIARRDLADFAVELCGKLGQDPPPEILEAVDNLIAAGDAYRRAGDEEAAIRCYEALAERLMARPDQRELLVPVLNRLFKVDRFLDDRFMNPLVEDVLQNRTTGPQATRVLMAYRARHRDDHRVTVRLFELMAQQGELEEALKLLQEMSVMTGSNPESVIKHFETLRRRFPDDLRIEVGRARAMIKAGLVSEAASLMQSALPRVRDLETARDAVGLVDSVFEWGHPDPELRNGVGQLFNRLGEHEAALVAFEQYVGEGGRDPAALSQAVDILSGRLVTPSGAPDHASHLRLAKFHLTSGAPNEAIPFLEVARGSVDQRVDADLMLARAEIAASNPRRAVQVLRDAIDGRHPRDTPELHYELARVYDVLGDRSRARQIDRALEQFAPEAMRAYQQERPVLEKRDTEWVPAESLEPAGDTDVGGSPLTSATEHEATYVETDEALTLEEALAPRYKLSKRLGAGGMGDVHLARDEDLGRPVAIKVLRRTLATDLFISKFREEARIVAKLSHPGIVNVYDIGQQQDWSYIVMEYVRGPNLSALVNASVPPTRYDLMHYIAAVADAMAYAHREGVIHRDLKPANILVGQDGKVKVTDFGIAHVLHGDSNEETAFSAAGLQVGTVNYMAPEQLMGRGIDARTDIYLLGTTLYYTLCRRYPFMGEAVALQKVREEPMPLSRYVADVSENLQTCISRCIAREPNERFQRMEELALVLRMLPEAQPAGQS